MPCKRAYSPLLYLLLQRGETSVAPQRSLEGVGATVPGWASRAGISLGPKIHHQPLVYFASGVVEPLSARTEEKSVPSNLARRKELHAATTIHRCLTSCVVEDAGQNLVSSPHQLEPTPKVCNPSQGDGVAKS